MSGGPCRHRGDRHALRFVSRGDADVVLVDAPVQDDGQRRNTATGDREESVTVWCHVVTSVDTVAWKVGVHLKQSLRRCSDELVFA